MRTHGSKDRKTRSKAKPGDHRLRDYRLSVGKAVDFDPTLQTRAEKVLQERLDRLEAIQFRLFLPRFREWQALYSQPYKVPE